VPATSPCIPTTCCGTQQTTQVPGPEGADGLAGQDGFNAFSTTTADFFIPAIGGNVTVPVDQSLWFAIGQVVVADGPANFSVVAVPTSTSVTLQFLGYNFNLSPGATISAGAKISPSGTESGIPTLAVYAAGTPYQLTATSSLLDFGTTDPTLTLVLPGIWLITASVRYDYTAATFAAVRTVTTKLTRTNNTPADVSDGSAQWKTRIVTTETSTALIVQLPAVIYSTSNTNDILALFGDVSVVPSAGSLDAVAASIVATRLSI
jgi:hypothetical protein